MRRGSHLVKSPLISTSLAPVAFAVNLTVPSRARSILKSTIAAALGTESGIPTLGEVLVEQSPRSIPVLTRTLMATKRPPGNPGLGALRYHPPHPTSAPRGM